jgi:hypothetical protein
MGGTHEIPSQNPKIQVNFNHSTEEMSKTSDARAPLLDIGIYLGFGTWDLEFRAHARDGIWISSPTLGKVL